MATAKSATARKTTTRRKPAAKKTTSPRVEVKEAVTETLTEPSIAKEYTEEERQGLLTSYTALKSAGLPVPDDIAHPVEEWIRLEQERRAAEQAIVAEAQAAIEEENAAGPWYVRNGYSGAPLTLRLERHNERRRIELARRGVPGDMHPLEDADLNDAVLKRNLAIGVCEIIPAGEAKRIADQQTTNVVSRIHTPTAILRNAKGQEYAAGAIKTELSYDERGVTVGVIDPGQIQGQYEDKVVANAALGGIARTTDASGNPVQPKREIASQFIPTGGNEASVQTGAIPQLDMAKARIADDLARRKADANPLAGMRVTVNAPQKG